ncbi:hypothetical protein MASR2M78_04270 [Treponema sp.]
MDAYRLGGSDDFISMGGEEYLYGEGICLIEWSERIQEVLPTDHGTITIEALGDGRHRFSIEDSLLEELLA